MSDISLALNEGAIEGLMHGGGPIEGMLMTGGNAVRARAQQLVHVRTGALRDSIRVDLGQDSDGPYARIGSFLTYALWNEIGTRRMGPFPFLRPALSAAGAGLLNTPSLTDSYGGEITTGTTTP